MYVFEASVDHRWGSVDHRWGSGSSLGFCRLHCVLGDGPQQGADCGVERVPEVNIAETLSTLNSVLYLLIFFGTVLQADR